MTTQHFFRGLSVGALCVCAGLLFSAEREPAKESIEDKDAAAAAAAVLDKPDAEGGLAYPNYEERRDVFLSMVDVLKAERQLDDILNENDNVVQTPGGSPVVPIDADDKGAAVEWAKQAVAEVETHIRNESWERAMDTAERHLNRLSAFLEKFPREGALTESETMLRQYYVLAENKKLYEEARAQFEALGLRIEGIIWSAEQPSLAIISGEPVARGINDRVRGTVIKNIDQNRVDFMYSYRQRRFHFQLYLEPNN
ncbi:MAG: hypothetical protein PF961_13820 [Planctomycetota bacterium]|jgi:hypothetical protein|nr:hypothetical protein [Planctomycetota bacterium]